MTKPYNDEEFERIKLWRKNNGIQSLAGDIDSLIATVESLKVDRDLWMDRSIEDVGKLTRVMEAKLELKEENAKLKAALDAALKRIEEQEKK